MLEPLSNRPKSGAVDDAPVVHLVQQLLEQAVALKASDLHFEPYEHHYRVRMRIDGELREVATPAIALKDRLASRIKVLSRLDIAEKRLPQDGRMKLQLASGRELDLRISTLPTWSSGCWTPNRSSWI
jgi:type IV pilus assembly protein PilB